MPTKQKTRIDLEEAERFLAVLDPGAETFCFQTFDDNPDRELRNKKLARCLTGNLEEMTDWLMRANGKHAGVFVAINKTDGTGRTSKNIERVRALMLDLDGKPIDSVHACALKPHIILETSPGSYHALWRVDGLGLDKFGDVQRGLARRFDGDPAVATLERCTRLPGFFHCKDVEDRFRVRIVELNERAPYSADDVLREFPPEKKAHTAPRSGNQIILPPGAPVVAAEKFIERHVSVGDDRLLHSYRGAFYRWTGTHYREYPEEVLERDLYAFLKAALIRGRNGEIGPSPGSVWPSALITRFNVRTEGRRCVADIGTAHHRIEPMIS